MSNVSRKARPLVAAPRVAGAPLCEVSARAPQGRPWFDSVISSSHADISVRQTAGTKLPILFLHGGGLCKDVFDHQLESGLGAQYRMIAIDWPGHGASGDAFDPARTYRLEGLADLALEILERLGIDHAVVVGASLGAWVGLQMVQTYPGLVGLALTAAGLRDGDASGNAPDLPEFALPGENGPTDDRIDAFLRESLGEHVAAPFARSAVERMDSRAMGLIHRDLGPGGDALYAVERVPSATVMIIDGDGAATASGNETEPSERRTREAHANYTIPHSGPAPFLDVPVVYNHLLQRFMQRMVRRERHMLASPMLWYGG